MPSPEEGNAPSLYSELFTGYADMAALWGAVNHGPLDPSLAPGKDGTLRPDGERATGYDYAIAGEELPQTIRDRGIDRIDIGNYTSTIMGDSVWNERTWVHIHERIGLTKFITLYKDASGEIEADFLVEANPVSHVEDEESLSSEYRYEIIEALLSGDDSWLRVEGPAGDFARAAYLRLTASVEPDASDIELLYEILTELG